MLFRCHGNQIKTAAFGWRLASETSLKRSNSKSSRSPVQVSLPKGPKGGLVTRRETRVSFLSTFVHSRRFIMAKGNPFGSKSAVVKKRKSKKRSGFLGTPKWKKDKERKQSKSTSEITFVHDCDVGTDSDCSVECTTSSSSKRKLEDVKLLSDEEYEVKEAKTAEGYRLVDMDSLRDLAHRIHSFSGNCEGTVLILEDPVKCYGLCSTLYVECDTCELAQFFSTGKHDVSDEVPRTMQGKDINRRSVFAANEVGLGREGIAALCEALNMPPPVAPTAWAAHEDELYKQHLTVINEELAKNKQELKELFQTDSSQPDESVLPVSVSFDGTWAKRGFTSNHGVGFVISTDTGKVLDYAVISKACNACKINQKRLSQEELELWRRDHDCVGGYEGSSPSMETECARTIWNKSRDYGLEYRFMVSDGDSKAYNSVWDVYGVCGDCNKYEQMEKSSPEYIKWKNSPEYKKWENDHL